MDGPDLAAFWDGTDYLTRDSYIFGFRSVVQFREWFPPANDERLKARGFGLSVYTVPDDKVITGQQQVAFQRAAATRSYHFPF